MKITVTFDSLEEFIAAMRPMPGFQDTAAPSFERAQEHVKALAGEWQPAEETPFTEEPKAAPAPAAASGLTEDFRVEVRRVLANLNKHTGQNTAAELIKAAGYKKLTEVPLEKLPAVMNAAKEALNA